MSFDVIECWRKWRILHIGGIARLWETGSRVRRRRVQCTLRDREERRRFQPFLDNIRARASDI